MGLDLVVGPSSPQQLAAQSADSAFGTWTSGRAGGRASGRLRHNRREGRWIYGRRIATVEPVRISDERSWALLQSCPELKQDTDLGRGNKGISIVVL